MGAFPAVDPIPLPAPVWLFVALHTLTTALHFVALHLLVGGLTLAAVWGLLGERRKDDTLRNASRLIGKRLPIVMTYVINLGIPPLLFAQVLYGRALYTSSIIIGAWWIGIVVLLMVGYSLLYVMVRRHETGRAAAWAGLIALPVILMIGMIYSTNMSLMLRPDTWAAAYRTNPHGTTFHTGDPTVVPRWLFMMVGSVGVGGVGLLLMSLKKDLTPDVSSLFHRWGGRFAAFFGAAQLGLGFWAFSAQPDAVRAAFADNPFYRICGIAWLIVAALFVAVSAMSSLGRSGPSKALVAAVAGASFLNVSLVVLVRDGIRNSALAQAGYNVWDRAVSTNWSTVILFLICFVVALAMVGWLASVVARAKPAPERYV